MLMARMKVIDLKNTLVQAIIAGVVLLVIITVVMVIFPKVQATSPISLGDGVFHARVAKTEADRVTGLSGVDTLPADQALLMVFPGPGKWQIWMKDMKIPLDIVWLDQGKKVIYTVKDATPDDSTNVIFTPKADAVYVIELPAGTVNAKAIVVGRTAVFDDSLSQGVK